MEGTEEEEKDVSSCWKTLRKNCTYCKLKEKALVRTLWRTHFGRGYGPLVRQIVWQCVTGPVSRLLSGDKIKQLGQSNTALSQFTADARMEGGTGMEFHTVF
jgi:hypothetical protein